MPIIDFWTTNLNPITLHSATLEHRIDKPLGVPSKLSDRVFVSKDLSQDTDFVEAKEMIKTLGIGAKKIKKAVINNGLEFQIFVSKKISYYKRCNVEGIEIELPSNINEEIPEIYVSGFELRMKNNWTSWDLWNAAKKNKWTKKKFKGNATYFLKEEVLKFC